MSNTGWHRLGRVEQFQQAAVTEVVADGLPLVITWQDGELGAISGVCNHAGGPLGQGHLDGEYVVCPWHHWKFHCRTGLGEPGYEDDAVPSHAVRVEAGDLYVDLAPRTPRRKKPHPPHPLTRPIRREEGPIRVAGISTTHMDRDHPRYSGSEGLLDVALQHAGTALECETKLLRLDDLQIRNCEGYYSKSARACTWPCSITQMDSEDEMEKVYEMLVHWADVVLVATPIRWGASSALYYRMAERLNCVQNQITIKDNVLIRNKVAGFIIVGGQDNVQDVAGHLLGFFSELGFMFPQFPYIAHSRGWSAEDMERNVEHMKHSEELRRGARELVRRQVAFARVLLGHQAAEERTERGGRKAHRLDIERAR
ncbi:MAG: (2Fe-2S)-binding protein [Thiotrichales bacterium SG8_50]|jgi:nitrite reductase/ring-hydroxylating ferredoxin subunit/multimeric flavodoxin WrbA|nr:MAG: (2Fe-2S)-binding protein [Thiotrichales bacterium SG8_50]